MFIATIIYYLYWFN